jgi:hypothetical protein
MDATTPAKASVTLALPRVIKIDIFAAALDSSRVSGDFAHGVKKCVFAVAVDFIKYVRRMCGPLVIGLNVAFVPTGSYCFFQSF